MDFLEISPTSLTQICHVEVKVCFLILTLEDVSH